MYKQGAFSAQFYYSNGKYIIPMVRKKKVPTVYDTHVRIRKLLKTTVIYLGCDKEQWRWRSKCISYLVLRGVIREQ